MHLRGRALFRKPAVGERHLRRRPRCALSCLAADLARMQVAGCGGSDMTPALARLEADPHVRAALVLTDGDVSYPSAAPPFDVLWVLTPEASSGFAPPYGRVLQMRHS